MLLGAPLVWMLLLTIQAPLAVWIISANFLLGAILVIWYLRRRANNILEESVKVVKSAEILSGRGANTEARTAESSRHLRSLVFSPGIALLGAVFVMFAWLALLVARWPTVLFDHRGWFVGHQVAVTVTVAILIDTVVLLAAISRTARGYGQEFKRLADPSQPLQPSGVLPKAEVVQPDGAESQHSDGSERTKRYLLATLIVAAAVTVLALASLLAELLNALVNGLSIHSSLTFGGGQLIALTDVGAAGLLAGLLGFLIYRIGELDDSGRKLANKGIRWTVIVGAIGIGASILIAWLTTPGGTGVPDHWIAVDDVRHMSESAAVARLVNAGFAVSVSSVEGFQPVDTVVAQSPAPKMHVSPSSIVTIDVSTANSSTNSTDHDCWVNPDRGQDWDGSGQWDRPHFAG